MRIAGWSVAASASSAVATATKAAESSKQHIIYGVDAGFATTPGSPVLLQILEDDVSPATVLWEGYVTTPNSFTFKQGMKCGIGRQVSAVLQSGGAVGKVNLHGITM